MDVKGCRLVTSQATIAKYFGSEGKVSANDAVEVLVAAAFPRSVGRRQGCPVRASRTPGEDVVAVFAHGVDGAGDIETDLGGVPTVAVARWLTDAGRIGPPPRRSARCAHLRTGRPISRSISRSMPCSDQATEPRRRKGQS